MRINTTSRSLSYGPRGARAADGVEARPGFLDEVERRLNFAWQRAQEAHTIIRCAAPALALQLFRTQVSGAGNYLMSLTEPSGSARKVTVLDTL